MAVSREKFVFDRTGKPKGVVLSMRRYRRLLEDLHDLAVVAERRSEKAVSLSALTRRLREDGVI